MPSGPLPSPINTVLSPRRSLRARLALAFGGLTVVLTLLLTILVEKPAQAQIERDIGNSLAALAFQLANTMDREVLERAQDVQLLAALDIVGDPAASVTLKQDLLNQVRQTYADYLWLGIVDDHGNVTVSAGTLPVGRDVSAQNWYAAAQESFFAGGARQVPGFPNDRFLVLAAPIPAREGAPGGVVAAYLNWKWVATTPATWQEAINSLDQAAVFILADDGSLLYTTANGDRSQLLQNNRLAPDNLGRTRQEPNAYLSGSWPDGEMYLTGYARSRAFENFPDASWLVLVRQPRHIAYRPVRQLQQQILIVGTTLGLVFIFLGWWLAGRIVGPLSATAAAADRIRHGQRAVEIPDVARDDELGLLSRSLRNLVAELTAQQQALQESQQVLERQVAARTRTLAALYHILEVASTAEDLQVALQRALQLVLDASGGAAGLVHLFHRGNKNLQLAAAANVPSSLLHELQVLVLDETSFAPVLDQRQLLLLDEASAGPALASVMREHHAAALASAPVVAGNQVLGVLSIAGKETFDRQTLDLLSSVGEELGVVIENARLKRRDEELAVLEERNRLARELHDSVTQSLYSVTLYAEAGRRLAQAGDTERTIDYLGRLGDTGHQALKEMRLLLHKLRPLALQQDGLVNALSRRLDAVEGKVGITHHLHTAGNLDLSPGIEEALYHISQEALNNALKHSGATEVTVALTTADGEVNLLIADNGCGFNAAEVNGGGMGLSTMRERARRFGGKLTIESSPGHGTEVRVRLDTTRDHPTNIHRH